MNRRLQQTAMDYLVIALNPALIITMILGLVFFLSACLYRGDYLGRLNFILFCFTLGAVLIARIAVEQGRSHASVFALPLGGLTLAAMFRFVEYSGPLAGIGLLLNIVLLGVIWWMADRITIDCTVIDEGVDASGAGLMQGGLLTRAKVAKADVALDGTTGTPTEAVDPEERALERRKRHRPGRWILYFALAAMPMFGLGQALLPANRGAAAVWCLALYAASALALLVSTSFLGLRRYLRQRKVEMPPRIAAAWLGGGGAMIVLLLAVCFLAPLPGQMLARWQLPDWIASPQGLDASRFGWGKEGPQDDVAQAPGAPAQENQTTDRSTAESSSSQTDGQPGGKQESSRKGQGQQEGKSDSQTKDQPASENAESQGDSPQPSSEEQSEEPSNENPSPTDDPNSSDDAAQEPGDERSSGDDPSSSTADSESREQAEPPSQTDQESATRENASSESSSSLRSLATWMGRALKLLLAIGLAAIVGLALWRYAGPLRDWWANLWPYRKETDAPRESAPVAATTPPRPFAQYRNPLLDGTPPAEAVLTTFAAFQAWGREAGLPRAEYTTPSEYAAAFSQPYPTIGQPALMLAELYNRHVYGAMPIAAGQLSAVKQLWEAMEQLPPATARPEPEPIGQSG